jgi:hypothetical protein
MTRIKMTNGNKYGAVRTYSELCRRYFSSKAEARRGEELALLERAGAIANLKYQPKFNLCDKPKITYTADFQYEELQPMQNGAEHWVTVYEDVKGVLTRETRIKLAWLKQTQKIEVNLIQGEILKRKPSRGSAYGPDMDHVSSWINPDGSPFKVKEGK